MPQTMIARVTCPNCQNQFQTPVEQILDVGADPNAKMRMLNGLVNMTLCPHCQARGSLNLPLFYHDPEKELALIFMPMEAGRDNVERQQAIGKLTTQVMGNLPAEQRKAYLLQPQEFFSLETTVNVILEHDGVTPEMIEQKKQKADLVQRMLDATSDEALKAMVEENDGIIDGELVAMLDMNLEISYATRQQAEVERFLDLREKLLEWSTIGKEAQARGRLVEDLRAEPTREKLLDLLIDAPDEQSRGLLVSSGRTLLDYAFFQALTSRIESAKGKEKERLEGIRTEILEVRDQLDAATRMLFEDRAALLRDLLLSDDPEALAREQFDKLDQAFLGVLSSNLEDAQSSGDETAVQRLQAIWALVMGLIEQTLPPTVRLLNRLLAAEDEAVVDELLEKNRQLVTPELLQFLEDARSRVDESDEEADKETSGRLAALMDKIRAIVGDEGGE